MKRCGECGWTNNPNEAQICEKCGTTFQVVENSDFFLPPEPVLETGSSSAEGGNTFKSDPPQPISLENAPSGNLSLDRTQAFDPGSFEAPPSFNLTDRSGKSKEFTGSQVPVGRNDLDPQNLNLSSKHLSFSFEGGQWSLQDLSSNGLTFIQAKGKINLQPGDLIVVGDKMFRFDPKS